MRRNVVIIFIIAVVSVTLAGVNLSFAGDDDNSQKAVDQPVETTSESNSTVSESDIESGSETSEPDEQEYIPPEVLYDLDALPFPTRRMHELILEATRAGDIEKLSAFLGTGENMTLLSLGGTPGDPIEFLKEQSGDAEGHEILAILEEILEAGYVHLDPGTDQELYVWPYFFALPINDLTDRQMVELFRIVTYGDFQDMEDFGGYIFYRVGITPTGRWQFFVAGD